MRKAAIVWIIAAILILALIVFFFPKRAGSSCGMCPPAPYISKTEYGCIGIRHSFAPPSGCMDCAPAMLCFGWVTSEKRCYTRIEREYVELPDCKTPETPEGILELCPGCFLQASQAAKKDNDVEKAIAICSLFETEKDKDSCLKTLSDFDANDGNYERAERFCNEMSEDSGWCISGIAGYMAEKDIDAALAKCSEIESQKPKDACYHNVAMKTQDKDTALEICGMIEEDVSSPSCVEIVEERIIVNEETI